MSTNRAELLHALRTGKCPDGGGPHCVCRLLDKRDQCVALEPFKTCGTCSPDGLFRMGMFTDVCGECIGTKVRDDEILDAVLARREEVTPCAS
jgi:hypothetical protein